MNVMLSKITDHSRFCLTTYADPCHRNITVRIFGVNCCICSSYSHIGCLVHQLSGRGSCRRISQSIEPTVSLPSFTSKNLAKPALKYQLMPQRNTLRPRQYCRDFQDDILKCILMNENIGILIKISLNFVPKVRINNIPTSVQIMAGAVQATSHYFNKWWYVLLTHICVRTKMSTITSHSLDIWGCDCTIIVLIPFVFSWWIW